MTRARDIANVTVTPTFPDGSINIADLNIDGGTDIGAALVDADLMVVDDGAGGTNRKATMARLATYIGTKVGGGMEFIASSGAISDGTASVAFTGFDASKYDSYKFYFLNVVPATDNVTLLGRVSVNGGGAYDSTSGNYRTTGNQSGILISNAMGGATGDTTGVSGEMTSFNPASTSGFRIFTVLTGFETPTTTNIDDVGDAQGYIGNEGTAINAIKFEMDSGNIESGEITMFGIVNS